MKILPFSLHHCTEIGVGFPHAAQTDIEFLQNTLSEAVKRGAKRVTLYDTNGSLDPFEVYPLVKQIKDNLEVPLFFHGHNDLGMATANSLAAVYAGADGLDVTINGLGDRAGNASLEQVVLSLHLKGFETGIILKGLKDHYRKALKKQVVFEFPSLLRLSGTMFLSTNLPDTWKARIYLRPLILNWSALKESLRINNYSKIFDRYDRL